ncbi:PE-PPE domain-containing protein [Mycobacterium asiaticum]|uniref:PE family protein n=1 Tax=Mycobacterium asiaticum TaxID=1790 RepID=A0A1A3MXA1_MYCAS|nr:PE-PPE domain-containing protein [Mycobacterium asiaticum]OBK14156.1 PE family protein [Mycobacterium asiaticum]
MSFLLAEPEIIAAAAANIEGIGSALATASAAAAAPTSTVLAAAADEVSAAVANLFGAYGAEAQSMLTRLEGLQNQFQLSLTAAAAAYADAETAIATGLQGLLGAPAAPAVAATAATLPPFAANSIQLIFGGTGVPIPTQKLIDGAENLFIRPTAALLNPLGVNTPEQLYPLTGVRSLYFNQSVDEGLTIMHNAIMSQIAAGETVTVFGVSQSAVMASLEMRNLANMVGAPLPGQLNFVLTGNEMNPNGGMLARFPGLSMPSLGLDFYGSTPANTPYPTAIYTLEYDGFADFPRYPLNLLADLNAVAGIVFVHPTYFSLPLSQVNSAIELPTSPGYAPTGSTHYYMIPTEHLPLLQPLRAIPVIGNPLANLIEPTTRVLVNLGYGDPYHGYSTSYADVPTPFGLFPDVAPSTVINALGESMQQGVSNFSHDMAQLMAQPPALPSLTAPSFTAPSFTALSPTDALNALAAFPSPEKIVNAAASIISTDYALLLPAADIGLGLVTSVPVYNAELFLSQLATGNLINAIGYPLAADVGLGTIAGAVYGLTVIEALANNVKDIQGLFA